MLRQVEKYSRVMAGRIKVKMFYQIHGGFTDILVDESQ
jgi:hypothetical protein